MADPLVREWGLSAATLEEVFLKLATSAALNAEVEGARPERLCTLCNWREAGLVTLYTEGGVAVTESARAHSYYSSYQVPKTR